MNQFIEEIFKHPWISNYPVISGITILVVLTVTFGKNILELSSYEQLLNGHIQAVSFLR